MLRLGKNDNVSLWFTVGLRSGHIQYMLWALFTCRRSCWGFDVRRMVWTTQLTRHNLFNSSIQINVIINSDISSYCSSYTAPTTSPPTSEGTQSCRDCREMLKAKTNPKSLLIELCKSLFFTQINDLFLSRFLIKKRFLIWLKTVQKKKKSICNIQ